MEVSIMITNYAIIDHVGQVSNISKLYARAYAEAIGYEKVYTLKKICQLGSPFAKEITNKMKWFNRFNKHPKKVYMICSLVDAKVEFAADAWRDRNIEVEFITEEPEPTLGFETVSRERRCAMIWGAALGWTFSAPLFRDERPESIDMYTARPHMDRESGSYGAKRFTKPESYTNTFRTVASEDECKAFFQHYRWLYENDMLGESLEHDWMFCPTCGRPVKESAHSCQWCDTEFEDDFELESFYEDSYNDDPDWNYEPSRASLSNFDVDIDSAELATKNYKTYLADCKVRDSGKFYFPQANAVETHNYNTMTLDTIENDIEKVNPALLACDPDGDATLHQLYWKRILQYEEEHAKLDEMLA
jgi:hypothetical protein